MAETWIRKLASVRCQNWDWGELYHQSPCAFPACRGTVVPTVPFLCKVTFKVLWQPNVLPAVTVRNSVFCKKVYFYIREYLITIQCRTFCLYVRFPEIWRLKHTVVYFCLLIYVDVKLGISHCEINVRLGMSENGVLRKSFEQKRKNITTGWRTLLWFWGVLAPKEPSIFLRCGTICLHAPVRAYGPGRPVRFAAHRQPLCWNSCTIHELFCL